MAFIQAIIKNPTRSIPNFPKASATVTTQQTVLMWASGLAVEADNTATPATVIGVCNQTTAAADAITQIPAIETFKKDVWIADCTNAANAAHDGQYMILTDSGHVNNTGTTNTSGIVQQVGVYSAVNANQILVQFV